MHHRPTFNCVQGYNEQTENNTRRSDRSLTSEYPYSSSTLKQNRYLHNTRVYPPPNKFYVNSPKANPVEDPPNANRNSPPPTRATIPVQDIGSIKPSKDSSDPVKAYLTRKEGQDTIRRKKSLFARAGSLLDLFKFSSDDNKDKSSSSSSSSQDTVIEAPMLRRSNSTLLDEPSAYHSMRIKDPRTRDPITDRKKEKEDFEKQRLELRRREEESLRKEAERERINNERRQFEEIDRIQQQIKQQQKERELMKRKEEEKRKEKEKQIIREEEKRREDEKQRMREDEKIRQEEEKQRMREDEKIRQQEEKRRMREDEKIRQEEEKRRMREDEKIRQQEEKRRMREDEKIRQEEEKRRREEERRICLKKAKEEEIRIKEEERLENERLEFERVERELMEDEIREKESLKNRKEYEEQMRRAKESAMREARAFERNESGDDNKKFTKRKFSLPEITVAKNMLQKLDHGKNRTPYEYETDTVKRNKQLTRVKVYPLTVYFTCMQFIEETLTLHYFRYLKISTKLYNKRLPTVCTVIYLKPRGFACCLSVCKYEKIVSGVPHIHLITTSSIHSFT